MKIEHEFKIEIFVAALFVTLAILTIKESVICNTCYTNY